MELSCGRIPIFARNYTLWTEKLFRAFLANMLMIGDFAVCITDNHFCGIIGGNDPGNSAEVTKHMDVRGDPRLVVHGQECLRVSELRIPVRDFPGLAAIGAVLVPQRTHGYKQYSGTRPLQI
jgi:hypothetical protein